VHLILLPALRAALWAAGAAAWQACEHRDGPETKDRRAEQTDLAAARACPSDGPPVIAPATSACRGGPALSRAWYGDAIQRRYPEAGTCRRSPGERRGAAPSPPSHGHWPGPLTDWQVYSENPTLADAWVSRSPPGRIPIRGWQDSEYRLGIGLRLRPGRPTPVTTGVPP
jgi:hypothetical protein